MKNVAVVTGANKGIGLAIVRRLCKEFPGDVILTARDKANGHAAVKLLQDEGLDPKFHQLDIDDLKSIDGLKHYMLETYQGVDVLVNNAGIAYKGSSNAPFSEQATVTNRINFFATMHVCDAFLPIIKDNGRVVNVASFVANLNKVSSELAAKFRSPELTQAELGSLIEDFVRYAQDDTHANHGWPNSAYAVSKIGVVALTKLLARRKDVNERGILVTCCCPGYVDTDMTSHKGPLTPDQGADTPYYLAMLPVDQMSMQGKFFKEREAIEW